MYASKKGHCAPTELPLAAKANVNQTNKYGNIALIKASMHGHVAPVETLLAAKANVDHTDKHGATSLVLAIWYRHNELAELPESWPQLTPLMRAGVLQSPQEIKALLHGGADPTSTSQLPSGTQTAQRLAISDPPRTWFSTTCYDTVDLI